MIVMVIESNGFAVEFLKHIVRERFPWRAKADFLTIQAQHRRRVAKDEAEIMRHHNTGKLSLVLKAMNEFVNVFFTRLVNTRRRFVDQKNVRPANQGKTNQCLL